MATPTPAAIAIVPPLNDGPLELTHSGFNPTINDVIIARRILTGLRIGGHGVPMEIALGILALASYNPYQSSIKQVEGIYMANDFWRPGPEASVAGLYLAVTTLAVPCTVARPKSITFQMKAADQGWADFGGDGTYENSHTWYEASILRPKSENLSVAALTSADMGNFRTPEDALDQLRDWGWDMVDNNGTIVWRVHNNVTASSQSRHYRVEWIRGVPTQVDDSRAMGDGRGFLELLEPDNVVVLWARAEVCVNKQ
ncbi:hypothetical protein O1611_g3957 [Lasiodiplodia mahajangana]|uniref:Uncharacterized protein n=1 Tax=Lasiodiplodia mahajangana TaxID=1108764 RepID=A0ACC2JQM3_9PEZI|nr:hypothetical protein O1611_g3957 [Lasiodiplodia mahajangana]